MIANATALRLVPITHSKRYQCSHAQMNTPPRSPPGYPPVEEKIVPMSQVDSLRWLNNSINNRLIDIEYARRVVQKLRIDSHVYIGDELTHRLMRDNFTPAGGIRWYLLDDPIMDYYFYKSREDPKMIPTEDVTAASEVGMLFEKSILDQLLQFSDIHIVDLVDVSMNDRLEKTREALRDGADIILNGLVVGIEHGIYGSPDIIMKPHLMYLLDMIMNKYQKKLRYCTEPREGDSYVIIEIKSSTLRATITHQYESRKMKYYQGQAYMYSLALEEMLTQLNISKSPIESFIMPASIKRHGPPRLNRTIDTGSGIVIYRNLSCIPVNGREIHEPLMEAISWNSFISRYVHDIDPIKMFISNTANKVDEPFKTIKAIHSIESGSIEYIAGVDKAVELRDQGIRTIFDPRFNPQSICMSPRRLEILREADIMKSVVSIPESLGDEYLRSSKKYMIVYYRDSKRSIATANSYSTHLYIRQNFDDTVLVVKSQSDAQRLRRELGRSDLDIVVLNQLISRCTIILPYMMNTRIFDISYALYRNSISCRYLSMPSDDSMKNDTLSLRDVWDFIIGCTR